MPDPNKIEGKSIPPSLQKIARLVRLMDSQFRIPGTNLTFGIDPIIGLIPGFGDLLDYGISIYLLISMLQNGASGKSVAKMVVNSTIDAVVGLVPFLGRFFDVFHKANRRNLTLAIEHFEEGKHKGSAWSVILPVLVVVTVIYIVLAVLAYFMLKWIWLFLSGMPVQ